MVENKGTRRDKRTGLRSVGKTRRAKPKERGTETLGKKIKRNKKKNMHFPLDERVQFVTGRTGRRFSRTRSGDRTRIENRLEKEWKTVADCESFPDSFSSIRFSLGSIRRVVELLFPFRDVPETRFVEENRIIVVILHARSTSNHLEYFPRFPGLRL